MLTRLRAVRRAGGRSRYADGQALVEFSLIAPIFFLIFFGFIEFALILASIGSYDFATRDAARLGSLLGRTDLTVDQQIVATVRAHVQGVVMATAGEIDVYKAISDGMCLDSSNNSTSVDSSTCLKNQYRIDGSLVAGTSVAWPVASRNDSLTSADYLGVRVLYTYTYLTAFAAATPGSGLSLSATSVQRIEPQDFSGHVGGPSGGLGGWASKVPATSNRDGAAGLCDGAHAVWFGVLRKG